MDEESRREFLRELRDYQELRHYQEVSRQSREATNFQEHADDDVADDQPSAGEEQLAGATDDDSADETYYLYNDDFLRDADNDEPAAANADEATSSTESMKQRTPTTMVSSGFILDFKTLFDLSRRGAKVHARRLTVFSAKWWSRMNWSSLGRSWTWRRAATSLSGFTTKL
jgi:hypothetical protein